MDNCNGISCNVLSSTSSKLIVNGVANPRHARSRHASDVGTETKVLVLYTGGTIGMTKDSSCMYKPMPNRFASELTIYPNLHDKDYAKELTSDANSQDTLLVLPEIKGYKRTIYIVHEYDPLKDSSNMTMDDWIHIALDIKENYESYDGFVVLHGTDTLSYTASALSFILENLGKPVIVTGSQIPLFESRSDGRENFLGALIIASNYMIPEVTVFFNNKLFRGNRTTKMNACGLSAFGSPNMSPLATIGVLVDVDWKAVHRSTTIEKFTCHTSLVSHVGLLRLFPGISRDVVRAFLSPTMRGVVLQTYGTGNGPSQQKDILNEIKMATEREVLIVNITQCHIGSVEATYETGQALVDVGVISGYDMTPETALAKLAYVLGKSNWDFKTKQKMIQSNLRGELTVLSKLKDKDFNLVNDLATAMRLSTSEEVDQLRDILFPALICAAVHEGNLEKLQLLEQYGGDVCLPNLDSKTPLHIAAEEGNAKIVKHLLLRGASVHLKDRQHNTPLDTAVEAKSLAAIELLVKAGAHLNKSDVVIGEDLCRAAGLGDLASLVAYHSAGACLNERDSTGRTALLVAVQANREDCVEFLLASGADPYAKDRSAMSAFDYARRTNDELILNILMAGFPDDILVPEF